MIPVRVSSRFLLIGLYLFTWYRCTTHTGMSSSRYYVNATLTRILVRVVKSWWTGTIDACIVFLNIRQDGARESMDLGWGKNRRYPHGTEKLHKTETWWRVWVGLGQGSNVGISEKETTFEDVSVWEAIPGIWLIISSPKWNSQKGSALYNRDKRPKIKHWSQENIHGKMALDREPTLAYSGKYTRKPLSSPTERGNPWKIYLWEQGTTPISAIHAWPFLISVDNIV